MEQRGDAETVNVLAVEQHAEDRWTVTDTRPTDLGQQWWKVYRNGERYAVYSRRSRRQMPRDAVYYRLVVAAVQRFEKGTHDE